MSFVGFVFFVANVPCYLTIVSSNRCSAFSGSLVRPVCTGDSWMIVLRGDTSQ